MTEEFDFDFDVDRSRSASRTESGEPEETGESPRPRRRFRNGDGDGTPANGNGARGNGSTGNGSGNGGNGSRGYAARAKELLDRRGELLYADEEEDVRKAPPARPPVREPERPEIAPRAPGEPPEDDWLSIGDDAFEPGSLSPLRERDDGPAGPPTPGEARNFAKEARRRASRRPSPILDFDEERARLEGADAEDDEDVDFESVLEHQPQKGRVARRGSAIRNAFEGSMHS
ncbi:MAG TPA: hypothetical protein VI035_07460, partial [Solirubrobacterales bacterium]